MFKEKRIEQQEAVTRLTKMKQQQRISIIQEMLNKMFEVLSSSLNNLSSMKIEAKKIELDQYNNTVSSLEVLDSICCCFVQLKLKQNFHSCLFCTKIFRQCLKIQRSCATWGFISHLDFVQYMRRTPNG